VPVFLPVTVPTIFMSGSAEWEALGRDPDLKEDFNFFMPILVFCFLALPVFVSSLFSKKGPSPSTIAVSAKRAHLCLQRTSPTRRQNSQHRSFIPLRTQLLISPVITYG
jgi:hypothetical protein